MALSVGTYVCTYIRIHVLSITWSCLEGFSHSLAEVITIMRQCVAAKNQVPRSKVKVSLKGQRSHLRLNLRIFVWCINFFLRQRLQTGCYKCCLSAAHDRCTVPLQAAGDRANPQRWVNFGLCIHLSLRKST